MPPAPRRRDAPAPERPRLRLVDPDADVAPGGEPTGDRGPAAAVLAAARADERRLLAVTLLLVGFGIVMVYSASSATGFLSGTGQSQYLVRQSVMAVIGLVALFGLRRLDYGVYRAWAVRGLVLAVGLLVLTRIAGVNVNGAQRWLAFGPIQFGPAEPAKLACVVALAAILSRATARLESIGDILRTAMPVVPVIGLVALQPDQGTATILVLLSGAMIVVAGARGYALATLASVVVTGAALFAWSEPYRRDRLLAFLDPFADPTNTGYQTVQALLAIGSGGLTGVGLGESVQKVFFLPEAHTDMIFAVIGEELGLIGMLAVIAAFAVLAVTGLRVARRARDRFGRLLAVGITTWLCGQAAINIAAVTGAMPLTGVPLPFVSYGGTSLVMLLAAVGILLSVARSPLLGRPRPRAV